MVAKVEISQEPVVYVWDGVGVLIARPVSELGWEERKLRARCGSRDEIEAAMRAWR